jgi:hypothetical protein
MKANELKENCKNKEMYKDINPSLPTLELCTVPPYITCQ